ncbi:uncharacterized protein B0H18DRAFT_1007308 [Fomitopsis serialis]|uniref:uncharacterized protein n=1 Tax=Fomitopsis serialis TaxID=139415 RepID=UPI002008D72B|nr:uncharacterized protein B0H18DRAFT_1007308 [Neoantrodia serialis]KAH9925985.1 hypothetical protein B0H18DRAFT_1007308 [Neoantrodia serialis]
MCSANTSVSWNTFSKPMCIKTSESIADTSIMNSCTENQSKREISPSQPKTSFCTEIFVYRRS